MKLFSTLLVWNLLPAGLLVSAAPTANYSGHDVETPATLATMEHRYKHYMKKTLAKRGPEDKCNSNTVSIRREWGSMSKKDRIEYTNAVQCLISKPPLSSPSDIPGARTRLDDFAGAHFQQSNNAHFNGNLYAWHRHFLWTYEQTLRKECGYKGAHPYWDWTLFADDPRLSPVFDGSETSMGGNGEVTLHGATLVSAFGKQFTLPPGTGGGCVTTGPFANLTVNLGLNPNILAPGAQSATNSTSQARSYKRQAVQERNPLEYNPRCLTRDLNLFWNNQTRLTDVEFLLSCPTVDCLEKRADGWELPEQQPQPRIHAAGHFIVGGLMNDPLVSPGDPIFFLHHGQMDRLWSIWQGQDAEERLYQVGGTKTPFNAPPSDPVSLSDDLNFGAVASSVKHGDVQSTIDGPFCYMYD